MDANKAQRIFENAEYYGDMTPLEQALLFEIRALRERVAKLDSPAEEIAAGSPKAVASFLDAETGGIA